MGRRDVAISAAITQGIQGREVSSSWWTSIITFFAVLHVGLCRYRDELFRRLRVEAWQMDEDEYQESFQVKGNVGGAKERDQGPLRPVGEMGYSGSTFFRTADSRYLIKSLPRRFEHDFFKHNMLEPYVQHMFAYPQSLLVRITDMLHAPLASLGGLMGVTPTHHIVMENVLSGKDDSPSPSAWETYDLKPASYFFPERDLSFWPAPASAVDQLFDRFPDTIRITAAQRSAFLGQLRADATFLAEQNTVDYSLFLVRYPASSDTPVTTASSAQSSSSPWRTGLPSADGKWIYRAVLLDFFWATDTLRGKAMTGLVKSFNVFAKKGPMTITTEPTEYRERMVKTIEEMVEVVD